MELNCKTNGVPPAFIYFMFTDNKTDGINVTKELSKDGHDGTQFTRSKFVIYYKKLSIEKDCCKVTMQLD